MGVKLSEPMLRGLRALADMERGFPRQATLNALRRRDMTQHGDNGWEPTAAGWVAILPDPWGGWEDAEFANNNPAVMGDGSLPVEAYTVAVGVPVAGWCGGRMVRGVCVALSGTEAVIHTDDTRHGATRHFRALVNLCVWPIRVDEPASVAEAEAYLDTVQAAEAQLPAVDQLPSHLQSLGNGKLIDLRRPMVQDGCECTQWTGCTTHHAHNCLVRAEAQAAELLPQVWDVDGFALTPGDMVVLVACGSDTGTRGTVVSTEPIPKVGLGYGNVVVQFRDEVLGAATHPYGADHIRRVQDTPTVPPAPAGWEAELLSEPHATVPYVGPGMVAEATRHQDESTVPAERCVVSTPHGGHRVAGTWREYCPGVALDPHDIHGRPVRLNDHVKVYPHLGPSAFGIVTKVYAVHGSVGSDRERMLTVQFDNGLSDEWWSTRVAVQDAAVPVPAPREAPEDGEHLGDVEAMVTAVAPDPYPHDRNASTDAPTDLVYACCESAIGPVCEHRRAPDSGAADAMQAIDDEVTLVMLCDEDVTVVGTVDDLCYQLQRYAHTGEGAVRAVYVRLGERLSAQPVVVMDRGTVSEDGEHAGHEVNVVVSDTVTVTGYYLIDRRS